MRFIFIFLLLIVSCKDSFNFKHPISVMQGPATAHKTVLNFIIPKNSKFEYVITEQGDKQNIASRLMIRTRREIKEYSESEILLLSLDRLSFGKKYKISFSITTPMGNKIDDYRIFSTLKHDQKKWKLMLASCMSDDFQEIANEIWPQVFKQSPDALLLIGDTVYTDVFDGILATREVTLEHYWKRFMQARKALPLYFQEELTPVYAIWDDHDFGVNDGGKDFVHKKIVQKIFRDFFPLIREVSQGPALSFKQVFGDHVFYFMDSRSFRSSKKGEEAHWGGAQLSWLKKQMQVSQKVQWPIDGGQFFGAYHPFESYQGNHPAEFSLLVDFLKQYPGQFYLISGDRHLYEFMEIPKSVFNKKTYELTTSGIHSRLYPGTCKKFINPYQVECKEMYHFTLLELDKRRAHFKIIGKEGQVHYQHDMQEDVTASERPTGK